jgi:hypothetical protein
MSLVQDDDMVQAFAAETPDEPFDVGVLPRTAGSDQYFFDPHVPHPLPKSSAVDTVPIAQEIAWRFFPRTRVHDLLGGPLGGGMLSDVEVDDATPMVGQDEQHEEHSVGHRRHHKEIRAALQ